MAESQSRYSIVERLTDKKLDIMSALSDLDEEIKSKQQKVEELKKELIDWESDIKEDVERNRRIRTRNIEKADREHNNAVERKASKQKSYEMKIVSLNDALVRIEEISKTAPQTQ